MSNGPSIFEIVFFIFATTLGLATCIILIVNLARDWWIQEGRDKWKKYKNKKRR